jgi:hypothetical protein
MSFMLKRCRTGLLLLCTAVPALLAGMTGAAQAGSEPRPGHVSLDCYVTHLQINDFSTRWQMRLLATISAPKEADLAGLEQTTLRLENPRGQFLELLPHRSDTYSKRFKAANAKLQYLAVEDTHSRQDSNAPAGFFAAAGPYRYQLTLQDQPYAGSFVFGPPLQMRALQAADAASPPEVLRNMTLRADQPLLIETTPASFGPVYYKDQDETNFVYQLANMDDSLQSGSYHPPVESPRYTLRVKTGDGSGTLTLLDPSRYVNGAQPYLIRSDNTATPLTFQPADLAATTTVLVDFSRIDTAAPNERFTGPTPAGDGWTGQLTVQDRVVYALYKDVAPTAQQLGAQADAAAATPAQ